MGDTLFEAGFECADKRLMPSGWMVSGEPMTMPAERLYRCGLASRIAGCGGVSGSADARGPAIG